MTGTRPVWTAGSPPAPSFPCLAQLRAHARPLPAVATVLPDPIGAGTVEVRLGEPVRGVATGQAVVLYDGDTVLGAATVAATVAATARVEPAEAGSIGP